MAWLPLLFFDDRRIHRYTSQRLLLLGMGALAIEILAGHPQYVFYTVIAAGIYTCFSLIQQTRRLQIVLGLTGMLVGAARWRPCNCCRDWPRAGESIRGAKLPFVVASSYSVPPRT